MRVRRREVVDEYAEGSRVALYSHQGVVVVLSDLASAAWWALEEDWVDLDVVAAALVEQFGEPPGGDGAASATEETLRTMSGHALVDLDET
jgi:hypothetical protein